MNNLPNALQAHNKVAFHMPGHKRNTALLGDALPYALDITEIEGFDHLQRPHGVLLDIMRRAQALWHSDGTYLSVNGSTGAILAGIRAMTQPGDEIIVARNCHMSVFHAIELCHLRPVFLEPQWLPAWGIYGQVTQQSFDSLRAQHPGAALCVLTSPSYEGIISEICTDMPLLIDAAHGAHLALPKADVVVHSLHKTLPALTQTALLHVQGTRVDRERLEHNLRIFQTSSPSYVLLASIEECITLLEQNRANWFAAWQVHLDQFYAHAQRWQNLRLFEPQDKSKLLIQCDAEVAVKFLRGRGIEPEYAHQNRILLMTSPCDTDEMMTKLTEALDELDKCALPANREFPEPTPAYEWFFPGKAPKN